MPLNRVLFSVIFTISMLTGTVYATAATLDIIVDNTPPSKTFVQTRHSRGLTYVRKVTQAFWPLNQSGNKKTRRFVTAVREVYDSKGLLKTSTTWLNTYDQNGKKVWPSDKNTHNYIYDAKDILSTEYAVGFSYDKRHKVVRQTGSITFHGNTSTTYNIQYDLNSKGQVVGTHVIGPDGMEIPSFTSIGYKNPSKFIDILKNYLPAPQPQQAIVNFEVQGDITFNANKTWDFSKFTINVIGSVSISPDSNGYDIYINGDAQIASDGDLDLSQYSGGIYVSGDLTLSPKGNLILGTIPIQTGGSLAIQTGGTVNSSGTITGDGSGTIIGLGGTIQTGSSISLSNSGSIQFDELVQQQDIKIQASQNRKLTYPEMAGQKDDLKLDRF